MNVEFLKSDKDKLEALLTEFGVLFSEVNEDQSCKDQSWETEEVQIVKFGKPYGSHDSLPECDKVMGYYGFYAQFEFDTNGKFITVGVWE